LIDGREETLQRTAAEGHEIAGHSWNHRQLTNLTEEEVKDQIMMTRAKIYDVTGKDSLVVRAPYGACDEMVQGVGKELGVSFYNWSIDTLDWLTKDPKAIEKEIMTNVSDGDIILCHDLHETTVDAMERVIPKLIAEGYQLVTVSELMAYSEQKVEAGRLYTQQ
jgi:peptidoglycan/xylan/chitin deacetylase (PgdA/CDA1 family)